MLMPMPSTFQVFLKEDEFYEQTLRLVIKKIHETLEIQEECRIGLSGGSTPKVLYRMMGKTHLPWNRITWIGIDERYVPMADKENNAGMILCELIEEAGIPKEKFLHFDTSLPYEESYLAFEQKLIQLKHVREPLFDVLILGAGSDGHIASIFPDSESVIKKGFLTAQTSTDAFVIHDRLTCTMEALTSCKEAILLLKGTEKHDLYRKLESGDASVPAGKFLESVSTAVMYLG